MSSDGTKIRKIIAYLDLSNTEFAESIGKNINTLSQYINGRRKITKQLANTIIKAYPQISYDWLRFGRGEMLINSMVSEFQLNSNKEGGIVIDKEKEYLKKENEALKLKVEMLEEALARRSWELITKSGRISNAAKKNNRNNNDK